MVVETCTVGMQNTGDSFSFVIIQFPLKMRLKSATVVQAKDLIQSFLIFADAASMREARRVCRSWNEVVHQRLKKQLESLHAKLEQRQLTLADCDISTLAAMLPDDFDSPVYPGYTLCDNFLLPQYHFDKSDPYRFDTPFTAFEHTVRLLRVLFSSVLFHSLSDSCTQMHKRNIEQYGGFRARVLRGKAMAERKQALQEPLFVWTFRLCCRLAHYSVSEDAVMDNPPLLALWLLGSLLTVLVLLIHLTDWLPSWLYISEYCLFLDDLY